MRSVFEVKPANRNANMLSHQVDPILTRIAALTIGGVDPTVDRNVFVILTGNTPSVISPNNVIRCWMVGVIMQTSQPWMWWCRKESDPYQNQQKSDSRLRWHIFATGCYVLWQEYNAIHSRSCLISLGLLRRMIQLRWFGCIVVPQSILSSSTV